MLKEEASDDVLALVAVTIMTCLLIFGITFLCFGYYWGYSVCLEKHVVPIVKAE